MNISSVTFHSRYLTFVSICMSWFSFLYNQVPSFISVIISCIKHTYVFVRCPRFFSNCQWVFSMDKTPLHLSMQRKNLILNKIKTFQGSHMMFVLFTGNTTGTASGTGTAYPSRTNDHGYGSFVVGTSHSFTHS